MQDNQFLHGKAPKALLVLNILSALFYLYVIIFHLDRGNNILFILLVAGEIYHLWQLLTYIHTVWNLDYEYTFETNYQPPVDIYITVAGEPTEIVRQTALAAKNMDYPYFKVFLLNDGLVTDKSNWQDIEYLAKELEINCITRQIPGGAKAGNINNAVRQTYNPFIVVFDADHVPHKDFLRETIGHFSDADVAFVQTPQFYKNEDLNLVTSGAWDQQALFFGPILRGKNRLNSTFMCGTNMVIRRTALVEAGGMCEFNIAEDFLTSLFIHEKGWKSVYVSKVLAEGLAPVDFLSYYKQQFRWARGSLEVLFKYNPFFRRNKMTIGQKIQYIASASFYISGLVVLMNAVMPLIFLFFDIAPINDLTMTLAIAFLPYILVSLYMLQSSANFKFSFNAVAFSIGSFIIHLKAIYSTLTGQKVKFDVTPKTELSGNFLYLVKTHLVYILLFMIGSIIAINREGISASVMVNIAWALFSIFLFAPFIIASIKKEFMIPWNREIKTNLDIQKIHQYQRNEN